LNFDYTDAQKQLRETTRDFAAEHIRPFSAEWDRTEEFPMDIIPRMTEMGFMGPKIPEKYGGMELDNISYAIITEEINAADTSIRTLMSVHAGLVSSTIEEWGNDEQKDYYLPKLATAELIGCYGLTEPNAGSWAVNQQTRVVEDGDDIIVNGTKYWISNGDLANIALAFGQSDPEKKHRGMVGFLVESGTPGFKVGQKLPKMGGRANHAVELVFEDCRIPKKNILGNIGDGFKVAMAALDHGRFSVAAGCVGIIQECLRISTEYANERITFDVPIGHHQLVQSKIAKMAADLDASRLLVYRCGHLKDKKVRSTRETSICKWFATETATDAAYECMQILGANGYSTEFPAERIYRDVRVTPIYEGTSEMQQQIIAGYELGYNRDKATPVLRPKDPWETV
jgi:alkylation response protein AidB-like acyl-CoA dehydrogenase